MSYTEQKYIIMLRRIMRVLCNFTIIHAELFSLLGDTMLNPLHTVLYSLSAAFIFCALVFLLRSWVFLKPRIRQPRQLSVLPGLLIVMSLGVFLFRTVMAVDPVFAVVFVFLACLVAAFSVKRRVHLPVDSQRKEMRLPASVSCFVLLLIYCLSLFGTEHLYIVSPEIIVQQHWLIIFESILFAVAGLFAGMNMGYYAVYQREQ